MVLLPQQILYIPQMDTLNCLNFFFTLCPGAVLTAFDMATAREFQAVVAVLAVKGIIVTDSEVEVAAGRGGTLLGSLQLGVTGICSRDGSCEPITIVLGVVFDLMQEEGAHLCNHRAYDLIVLDDSGM